MNDSTSRRNDFLSQERFADGYRPRADALGHDAISQHVIRWIRQLEPGSVIGVQGSWGRGKTDILARVALATWSDDCPERLASQAIWINPWQYGTPDLLTPLARALGKRAEGKDVKKKAEIDKMVGTLIKAGTSFGMTSMAGAVTGFGGGLLGLAAPVAAGMIGKTVDKSFDPKDDPDPVAAMSMRFRQLAEAALSPDELKVGARLIICVDDLDRCLPDRQVALLRALRFVSSAGAPVSFLVALDPVLAREGVVAHYRTTAFDPERYLDKMFHLRLNLPAIQDEALVRLVTSHLRHEVLDGTQDRPLAELLQPELGDFASLAPAALPIDELRNPRVVQRVFDKLQFLAQSQALPKLGGYSDRRWLVGYLALSERWPAVRQAMQVSRSELSDRLEALRARYVDGSIIGPPAVVMLPTPNQSPGLVSFFKDINPRSESEIFARLEAALVGVGL